MKTFSEWLNSSLTENVLSTIFNSYNTVDNKASNTGEMLTIKINNIKLANPLTTGASSKIFDAKDIDINKSEKYKADLEFNSKNGKSIKLNNINLNTLKDYIKNSKIVDDTLTLEISLDQLKTLF